ncbi:MAG: SsgA family sporulation/cell division regulator [Actinomycetota bacterium]|nr:SsgA family sporulation/cell division regulator [Actinomycetota bacterium]
MTSNDSVVQDMFAVLHGQAAPAVTRWTYLVDDPFAVTFSIRTRSDRWVTWVMARELLLAGLTGSAGVGDIRLCPRRVHGYDILVVEISSPDGHAALEIDRDLLGRFALATMEVVPLGSESSAIDMDAEIEKITRSCAE